MGPARQACNLGPYRARLHPETETARIRECDRSACVAPNPCANNRGPRPWRLRAILAVRAEPRSASTFAECAEHEDPHELGLGHIRPAPES